MGLRRILFVFALLLVTWFAAEGRASAACITGAGCSGTKPTCDLLTFSCRACRSDVDCGAPFSGDICQTEGPQAGACVNAADAGPRNCSQDSECDTLGGYICSGISCVLGCHVTLFGDTCLVGAHCVIPIDVSISIGTCTSGGGGGGPDGGGIHDAGPGGDASTGCQTDADCGLSSGRVCVPGEHGNSCEPGCHDTAAGDTCPPPTKCSVTGGGLGVCREPGADGGPIGCKKDTDCAAPGVVCVDDQCVVGCHDVGGGDTCPGGTQCSVMNGGLGICVNPGDGGTPPITCTKDVDCPSGLVCSGTQCVNGCRDTDGGDTCPGGAICSVADGGVGICSGGGGDAGPGGPMPCTVDSDCNGGLVCVGLQCVVGCRDTDAGTDTCLLGTGGACSMPGAGVGQCLGSDGGVTPVCTQDGDCAHGLVCDSSQCVVGCHETTAAGDTCDPGSTCSVAGGGLGVCIGNGADGGPIACTQDTDCSQGEVCDQARCVVGCHDTATGGDTCAPPTYCDAVGGSLGVCIGNEADGGSSDASDEGDGSLDGSNASPDATAPGDASTGPAGEPTFEGGGCGCTSAHHEPAEGGGLVLLLAVTLFVRKRASK
jgi:hypothetical protein